MDGTDNSLIPKRPRSKPPSSIEYRAEPMQASRTNIIYPVIQSLPSPNGIKSQAQGLAKGMPVHTVKFTQRPLRITRILTSSGTLAYDNGS